jgi:hypothetical protein
MLPWGGKDNVIKAQGTRYKGQAMPAMLLSAFFPTFIQTSDCEQKMGSLYRYWFVGHCSFCSKKIPG